jgi:DNA polymerase V
MTEPQVPGIARTTIPFVCSRLHAGFPSPADDYRESKLDLDSLLIQHPEATFYVQVTGDSMINAGIAEGDIVVVDRSLAAMHNAIIVAMLGGEFTLKRLSRSGNTLYLVPANPRYRATRITEEMEFQVWGVATYCIHRLR